MSIANNLSGRKDLGTRVPASSTLDTYYAEANRHPLLSREEEAELAQQYQKTGKIKFAHQLVNSNLRFVVKIAHEYRGYSIDLLDLIQEGNLGLMMAVKKFDPGRGTRLISYAVWWIRAYIQNYVLRSWSLVKVGTTQAQRRMFFRLRSTQNLVEYESTDQDDNVHSEEIARRLGVKPTEVEMMNVRMQGRDQSLNTPAFESAAESRQDRLASNHEDPEASVGRLQTIQVVRSEVARQASRLNQRELSILQNRLAAEEPRTLSEIGKIFGVSRERVRQIESNLLKKLRSHLEVQLPQQLAS